MSDSLEVNFYSARRLWELQLPGLPGSEKAIRDRVVKERWPSRVVRGGGGPGGTRTEYQPPPEIQARIDEKQRRPYEPAAAVEVLHTEQPRAGYVYIPLYDVRAAAGTGTLVEHEQVTDLLAFKEEWLRSELNASPKDVVLLFVQGRSMEPDLRAGDVIMIDLRDTTAQREAIYVLRLEGAIVVKEVQRLPGGRVKVLSKNAGYDSWEFNVSELNGAASGGRDIAVIGRVVWACRRF